MAYCIVPQKNVRYKLKENKYYSNSSEIFEAKPVEINFEKTQSARYNGDYEIWACTFAAKINNNESIIWIVNISRGLDGFSILDSEVIEYPESIIITNDVRFEIIEVIDEGEDDDDDDDDTKDEYEYFGDTKDD